MGVSAPLYRAGVLGGRGEGGASPGPPPVQVVWGVEEAAFPRGRGQSGGAHGSPAVPPSTLGAPRGPWGKAGGEGRVEGRGQGGGSAGACDAAASPSPSPGTPHAHCLWGAPLVSPSGSLPTPPKAHSLGDISGGHPALAPPTPQHREAAGGAGTGAAAPPNPQTLRTQHPWERDTPSRTPQNCARPPPPDLPASNGAPWGN